MVVWVFLVCNQLKECKQNSRSCVFSPACCFSVHATSSDIVRCSDSHNCILAHDKLVCFTVNEFVLSGYTSFILLLMISKWFVNYAKYLSDFP